MGVGIWRHQLQYISSCSTSATTVHQQQILTITWVWGYRVGVLGPGFEGSSQPDAPTICPVNWKPTSLRPDLLCPPSSAGSQLLWVPVPDPRVPAAQTTRGRLDLGARVLTKPTSGTWACVPHCSMRQPSLITHVRAKCTSATMMIGPTSWRGGENSRHQLKCPIFGLVGASQVHRVLGRVTFYYYYYSQVHSDLLAY